MMRDELARVRPRGRLDPKVYYADDRDADVWVGWLELMIAAGYVMSSTKPSFAATIYYGLTPRIIEALQHAVDTSGLLAYYMKNVPNLKVRVFPDNVKKLIAYCEGRHD